MGACSLCHENGHNRRTCSKQPIQSSKINTISSTGIQAPVISSPPNRAFSSTSNSLTNPNFSQSLKSPSSNSVLLKQQLNIPENVRYLKPLKTNNADTDHSKPTTTIPTVFQPQEMKVTKISKKLKNQDEIQTLLDSKQNEIQSKIDLLPTTPDLTRKIEKVSNGCKSCDKLLGSTGYWLSSSARQRLIKGPTEKDGLGYIYIYTYSKPRSEQDQFLFKIGMSEFSDGKRRIQVQERKNKEEYRVVFHEETPFRYLSENVIHLELKDVRSPRDSGDGRTEWFKGTGPAFTRLVKDVIKEVRFGNSNGIWSPLHLHEEDEKQEVASAL